MQEGAEANDNWADEANVMEMARREKCPDVLSR